ncbi:Protein couch potato, partial [Choanephora cucurbitarum]
MISEPTAFGHPFSFNDIQRVHPLSASPGPSAFLRATSPVQPTVTTNSTNNADDVTTIFVVGFPEDMGEREFQNMFTFCQGFEAASLKWHCKDQEEDGIPSNGGKKQMIGFARFRTRLEAMEAIDVLSGKKIDQDKGTVLKAEMAKKNLHIKRGSATQTTTNSTSSSTSTAAITGLSTASPTATASTGIIPTESTSLKGMQRVYDALLLPSDLLSPQDYKNDPLIDSIISPTTSFNDSLFGIRSQSIDHDLGFVSPRAFGLSHSLQQSPH